MDPMGEFVSGSAGTGSQGASALNHEIGNDTMKSEAIVKATFRFLAGLRIGKFFCAFGQADEIRHGLRRFCLKQAADNVSLRGLENGVGSRRSCQSDLPNDSSCLKAKISRRS